MPRSYRSEMYAMLAELMATPPDWMFQSGRAWPLFNLLTHLAPEFDETHLHLDLLASIPFEPGCLRRERYASLFTSGKPRFWLYESAAKTGKILGSSTFEMAQLYRTAGLEVGGAELPDHISLELTFLSYLSGWDGILLGYQEIELQFLELHGSWMIDLGHAMKKSGDPVYGPIGQLLSDWITDQMNFANSQKHVTSTKRYIPIIPRPDECTLCGFCAQICPTRALQVLEDRQNSFLTLNISECVSCGKCKKICDFNAIKMEHAPVDELNLNLRNSPIIHCNNCGQNIASEAEMNYISSQIGEATWQHFCMDCRVTLYK